MASALQNSLRNLIANAKTKQALDALAENLFGTDEGSTITLLQARWNRNERAFMSGLLDNADYNMEVNRINYALLSVIGDLEDSSDKATVVKQVQEVIYKIENIHNYYGDTVMGDKVTGTKVMGDVVHGDKFGGDKVMGNKTVNQGTTVVAPQDTLSVKKKKTILFVAANPAGKNDISAGKEKQIINEALNSGGLRDEFVLVDNFASRVDDFLILLKRHKPTMVHLSMHGGVQKGVFFEDESGNAEAATGDDLLSFFQLINRKERIVACVLLSACNSDEHAKTVQECVNYTIGMHGVIPVPAALEYARGFYKSFFEDEDYAGAHDTAIVMLKKYAKKVDYEGEIPIPKIPQLYSTQ